LFTTTTSRIATAAPSPSASQHTSRQVILPGDRVLVYDTGRFCWHEVTGVLIGVRTRVKIQGANFYFDSSLVAKHERRSVR
jgi:hypothetical protein